MTAPRRLPTYSLLVGTVVGTLFLGLAVPFVFGRPSAEFITAASGGAGSAGLRPLSGLSAGVGAGGIHAPGAAGRPAAAAGTASPAGAGGAGPIGRAASGGGSASNAPATGPVRLTASDRGVTATTIKVGIGVPNVAGLSQLGFAVNGGNIQGQWQALIDNVNAHGGILGRKIVPYFISYDTTSSTSMQSACIQWTQNDKVFAVLNTVGFYGPPVLCVTQSNKTPFITADDEDQAYFAASGGLLMSTQASADRILANLAYFVNQIGGLKGQKIGILDGSGFQHLPIADALIPTLHQLGYTVTDEETISTSNTSEDPTQISVAAQNMKAKGVTAVFLADNYIVTQVFVQDASNDFYYPHYYVSDFAGLVGDGFSSEMPKSYNGTFGFTGTRVGMWRVGMAQSALDAACVRIYNQASGANVTRGSTAYQDTVANCGVLQIFVAAATAAGPDLTRTRLSAAASRLGAFALPGMGGGSFGPGKLDAEDYVREVQWHYSCKCFEPYQNAPFVRTPY